MVTGMRSDRVTRAAAGAGVVFRWLAVAVRTVLLAVAAAAAVVIGVAIVFGAGWAWIAGGVLGLLLAADWRSTPPPGPVEAP